MGAERGAAAVRKACWAAGSTGNRTKVLGVFLQLVRLGAAGLSPRLPASQWL